MQPFNIIDGFNELFDDTCVKQVVSKLIRNPLVWNFLGDKGNFNQIQKILGNDPSRWTILGVLESAACLALGHVKPVDSDVSSKTDDFISEEVSVVNLLAYSLRTRDYIEENSFNSWLVKLNFAKASEDDLWKWAVTLSMVLMKSDQPLIILSGFALGKNLAANRLLAYTVHSDPFVAELLFEHLEVLCKENGLSWLVELINHLDFIGDYEIAKKLAEVCLNNYLFQKPYLKNSNYRFDELLAIISENRNLIKISQKAENKTLSEELLEQGKIYLSKLLNLSGISSYDPMIFENFNASQREEVLQDTFNFKLNKKINEAYTFLQTDVETACSIIRGIYQELNQGRKTNWEFEYIHRHRIIDLLQKCNLIVECADMIDQLLIKFPNDVHLLRIATDLFYTHGNHTKATRYFHLLDKLNNLSREEKIRFAESLAYEENFHLAYQVRALVNSISPDDTKILLFYAINAELNDEIYKLLSLNQEDLVDWSLTKPLSQYPDQLFNQLEWNREHAWSLISNRWDRDIFTKLLEKHNEKSLIKDLLKKSFSESANFSSMTIKLIQYYLDDGDFSSIIETLTKTQLNPPIDQKDIEKGISLLLQYGLVKKATQWIEQLANKWQLSPTMNLLRAEISLREGDFSKTQQLLNKRNDENTESERSLILYSLALLNAHPNRFPLGLERTKIPLLKGIEEKLKENLHFSDTTLRILRIYLNDQNRIEFFEKEMADAVNIGRNDTWRFKAAIANEYFYQRHFDLAIQYFKEVERTLPFDPELLRKLLECYLRLKLDSEAEIILHRLLAVDELNLNDLIDLSYDNFQHDEWITFLDSQIKKFPDSKEIKLLFSLSSYRHGHFVDAVQTTKNFLTMPDLSVNEKLIAAQVLAVSGDPVFAERIIDILFSENTPRTKAHYLTAALIYQSMGEFSKALIMLNHLQPFDRMISGLKLDLMLRNGNHTEALQYLQELRPVSEFGYSTPRDLLLMDNSYWQTLIEDRFFFEKVASKVWITNKDLPSALKVLERGFRLDNDDEGLACQLLELAKLISATDLIDQILQIFEGKEIRSKDLICSLAESAWMLNQEIFAAHYLSQIIDANENQHRIRALQSALLKRNGNSAEAKMIYHKLINEIHLNHSRSLGELDHRLWLASLAFEMDDFANTMEICRQEIEQYGLTNGFANTYLKALLGLLRQNVLFEKLNCSSQVIDLPNEQFLLFSAIENDYDKVGSAEFDSLTLKKCKAYLDHEFSHLENLSESDLKRFDTRDQLYFSVLQKGNDKTWLESASDLKNQQDLIFFAALLVDENPERSLALVKDHVNLLSKESIHLALLAKIYSNLGNFPEAYAAITLALNIEPKEYGWEILAGEISQKRGDAIAAIGHFENANSLSKNSTHIEQLNHLQIQTGSEQAIPILESKFSEDPNDFDLAIKIALMCLNFNKPGKATHYFNAAIQLKPKAPQVYAGLSKLSAQMKNYEKALDYANTGLQLCDRDYELLVLKTDLMKKISGIQYAKDFLEKQALINDDVSADLQAVLADIIYEMYGLDECLAFIASKESHQQTSKKFLTTRLRYLLMAGNTELAKEIMEKTINEFPDNAEVIALMGEYYRIQGDLEQAIGHYLHAIKINPMNENFFINLFEIYNVQRDSESAKQTLISGMKAIPYSAALPLKLAKFYLQNGLDEQANESIDKALRLQPHNEEAEALKQIINQQRLTQNHEIELLTE